MSLKLVLLILVTGVAIASGQVLLALFARSLPKDSNLGIVLKYTFSSINLYGFALLYLVAILIYTYLLRHVPLGIAVASVVAVALVGSVFYTFALDHVLRIQEIIGVSLIISGVFILWI